MPVDLFGFSIGRSKLNQPVDVTSTTTNYPSFVVPTAEEGASYIDAGGFYGAYLDLDGAIKTESQAVAKYREMALHPEIESAVEDICNEAIVYSDLGHSVNLMLDNNDSFSDSIKQKIYDEFDEVLRMLDFDNRGYEMFRRWYIDGKGYYHIIIDDKNPKKGIQELRAIDARKIRKMVELKKGTDAKTKTKVVKGTSEFYVYREKETDQTGIKIAPESICYFHSGLYDANSGRVLSYLNKAIKPLNQLRMVEDALVIYRLSRAPERRIFYIDVGSLPKNKAEQYVKQLMNRYRNKLVYDANTGEIRDDKKFMSMLEDYWLPRREGGKGTEIDTLSGGENLGEMDDVEYFQKKLYRALNIPMTRLEADNGFNMGRASEISRDELKFSKFIARLRNKFNYLFLRLLRTQCILKGIMSEEEWKKISGDIRFDYVSDSHFAELKEYEIVNERMSVLRDVQEYVGQYYSLEYVRKHILRQTDEEIMEMDKQIQKEREAGLIPDKNSMGGF